MNYYNPYFFGLYPTMTTPSATGMLGNTLGRGNFSFSSLLSGAQKTLNFVNQAIPVVKQVSPMMKNAKTMFRVMNEFKKVDTPNPIKKAKNNTNVSSNNTDIPNSDSNIESVSNYEAGPTFFV